MSKAAREVNKDHIEVSTATLNSLSARLEQIERRLSALYDDKSRSKDHIPVLREEKGRIHARARNGPLRPWASIRKPVIYTAKRL